MAPMADAEREGAVEHCPACRVAAELLAHRDSTAPDWGVRRATLNFAAVVARRACPAYVPSTDTEGDGNG